MENTTNISIHSQIQDKILDTCNILGIESEKEFRGKGWRADVFVPNNGKPIAFEIQLSAQSLKKTLERQSKYTQDGIIGCWLFENPIPKLIEERPDLPVFYVERNDYNNLIINLGDRRKIDLQEFLYSFISNKIQFKTIAKTSRIQDIHLVFYELDCWNCNHKNHLYYVDKSFLSSCNAEIRPNEALWESSNMEYMPEVIAVAKSLIEKQGLKLGEIKPRYSKMVQSSYVSFGCYNCDSIFGDYYVFEAKLEIKYDTNKIVYSSKVDFNREIIIKDLPHWCYPKDGDFCHHS